MLLWGKKMKMIEKSVRIALKNSMQNVGRLFLLKKHFVLSVNLVTNTAIPNF
jgi:hypothetical protein